MTSKCLHPSLIAACALAAAGFACQPTAGQSRRHAAVAVAPGTYGSPHPGAVESYMHPQAPRQLGSALLFLPGSGGAQQVTFATLNGQAVLDGDIMLGPATALPFRYGMPGPGSIDRKGAVAVVSRDYLWPNAEIPYVIDASAQHKTQIIEWGIELFRSTALRIRPRSSTDRDYVVFRELGVGCWSYLGRQGGPQDIDVTACAGGNVAHELLHAAGFYHEQSRGDRDQYISIVWDEISPEMRSNFEKRDARGQDIGPYDYGSIMHYPSHAGSRTGNPTIVPRQPGVRIGQREELSALDRAAIETLYAGVSRSPSPALGAPASPTPTAPPPAARPLPVPAPPLSPAAPASTPPTPSPAPVASNSSFSGTYGSARGAVSCTQGGVFVQCQYPGGTMICAAGSIDLACTWSGGGQGRAAFQRQPNGVLAGTWGDGFSADSRGRWDLVPQGATASPVPGVTSSPAPPPGTPPPAPHAPPPAPSAPPAVAAVSLSGNYSSTRGQMACTESGASFGCNFQEADGVSGRLDCTKSQTGLDLACGWITFFPRPATGRAQFRRASPNERRLSGTWGLLLADSGAGTWDAQGQ